MPTTATGTAYTITTSTSTGYGTCLVAVADAHASDADVPTILYAHGASGSYNQFMTLAAWTELRDWLIDNGCAIVEGGGGLTDSAGAQNWGNANARLAYVAYLAWAAGIIDVGPVVPLGRSMGGVVAPWLYLSSSIASQCVGLIVNSGVQTLSYGTVSDANTDLRPSGQYFGSAIQAAYGAGSYGAFVTASHDHDPMNFDPALWDDAVVLQLVGDADTTVSPSTRGAYPLRALYAGRPTVDLLDVRSGGDHSGTNGSYLQVAAQTAFLSDLGFGTAIEIPDPVAYEIESLWLVTGEHELTQMELQIPPA